MKELDPCPFCGGTANRTSYTGFVRIRCQKCPAAMVGPYYTDDEITDAWNGKIVWKDKSQTKRYRDKYGRFVKGV